MLCLKLNSFFAGAEPKEEDEAVSKAQEAMLHDLQQRKHQVRPFFLPQQKKVKPFQKDHRKPEPYTFEQRIDCQRQQNSTKCEPLSGVFPTLRCRAQRQTCASGMFLACESGESSYLAFQEQSALATCTPIQHA